jgi:hypothetical protein
MIKVINLVALIFAPVIMQFSAMPILMTLTGAILVLILAIVIWHGKREGVFTKDSPNSKQ